MIAFQEMINRQMKRPAPHEWQHISLCAKWHAGRHKKINAEVVGIQVVHNNEIIIVFKKGFKRPFSEPQFFKLILKNKASLFILKTVKFQETKKRDNIEIVQLHVSNKYEETVGRPSDGGDGDEEVGSSHVDRNGPTKFYPTIREARRGSGPRPTAATARSARAAFSPELRLASELRVREAEKQRCPERRRSVVCGISGRSDDCTRAGVSCPFPRAPPKGAKGVGATLSLVLTRKRDSPSVPRRIGSSRA
ncbi:hypothetical protein ALC56_12889 [Trachymyrmex septentrionalis]|uniref:Uncharacterized protein n=1 Tax=Trachymyrmex septentrionalis TaxID=34720 RepID=A0A195EY63_9HYME|nr:hypothetical protein ALC56_12889 [Trachymyrmex septentrionalis]